MPPDSEAGMAHLSVSRSKREIYARFIRELLDPGLVIVRMSLKNNAEFLIEKLNSVNAKIEKLEAELADLQNKKREKLLKRPPDKVKRMWLDPPVIFITPRVLQNDFIVQ